MAGSPDIRPLFDRSLLRRRLRRAAKDGDERGLVLLEEAAREVSERLSLIERRFDTALLAAPAPQAALPFLEALPSIGNIVSMAPVAPLAARTPLSIVGDEEALPAAPESLDLIVSLMSLHHVNDVPGALVQARRALKPNGLFLAVLLGGETLTELRLALAGAEAELSGGAAARVAPLGDVRDYGALLQRAGLAIPVADRDRLTLRYGSLLELLADLRRMGATNVLASRATGLPRKVLARAGEIYEEHAADPDGRVRATFELVALSGWAPHESQQKPLRPGSAAVSLKRILGSTE